MKHVSASGRRAILGMLAILALLSVPLSGALAGTAKSSAGGTFRYAGRHVTTFFPGNYGSDPPISRILLVGLMRMSAKTNKPVLAIAKSVTTHNNKVWTIKLRPGWKFQNGEKITAATFANTWNFNAYGPSGMAAAGLLNIIQGYSKLTGAKPAAKKLSGLKVVNPLTLRVTLTSPFTLFTYLLASDAYLPLPSEAIKNPKKWDANPIGDGPYRVVGGFNVNAPSITFARWSGYKGTKGKAAKIIDQIFIDWGGNTVYNAVRAGSVDVAFLAGGNALADALKTMPSAVTHFNVNAVLYLGFPTWDNRFSNKSVRQAFSLAIDRAAIVRSLASGIGAAANGLVPPSVAGGGIKSCSVCTYNPTRAKQLLTAGGGWSGPLTLWTYNDDPVNVQVIQAIANEWRNNLGIQNIQLQAIPVGQLYPKLFAKQVDGPVYLYQGGVYPHMFSVAQQLLTKGGIGNVVAYDNPQVDTLLTRAAAAKTPKRTLALTQQATKVALADAQIMPIYWPGSGLIHSNKVSGVHPAPPYGNADLEAISVK
jgi:peptide/nickel transport system substrate-binding protein/oligopeptide transport system substrate-binding protein